MNKFQEIELKKKKQEIFFHEKNENKIKKIIEDIKTLLEQEGYYSPARVNNFL